MAVDIEALNRVAELAAQLEQENKHPLAAATVHELFIRMASAEDVDDEEEDGYIDEHLA